MIAKTLRNPALRTKFKVGETYVFPRDVWTRLTRKTVNLEAVSGEVTAVGDKMIRLGKNRSCRFAVTFKTNHSTLFGDLVVWEEWMLEMLVLMYHKATSVCSTETGFRVNNHMVVFAFRYALGRQTGAVGIVVDHLTRHWPKLNRFDRDQIKKEIVQAIKMGDAGSDCDIQQWQTILQLDHGQPPWKHE